MARPFRRRLFRYFIETNFLIFDIFFSNILFATAQLPILCSQLLQKSLDIVISAGGYLLSYFYNISLSI